MTPRVLQAAQAKEVASAGTSSEALAEERFSLVVLAAAQVGLDQGLFENVTLSIAAAEGDEFRMQRFEPVGRRPIVRICEGVHGEHDRRHQRAGGRVSALSGGMQAVDQRVDLFLVQRGGERHAFVDVRPGRAGAGKGAQAEFRDGLPGQGLVGRAIELAAPKERGGVGHSTERGSRLSSLGEDALVVKCERVGGVAAGQLEESLMPAEMRVELALLGVGGEPVAHERGAFVLLARFEVDMGHGVHAIAVVAS